MISLFQSAKRKASDLWTRPAEPEAEAAHSSPDMADSSAPLFANCRFALVGNEEFTAEAIGKATSTIKLHGGEVIPQSDDPAHALPLSKITHIISATHNFRCYDEAVDRLIPVVKPAWIDASLARSRLQQTRQFSPDPRLFMSGVVILTVDLPEGDSEALIGGVMAMGGLHNPRLTPLVTHIVALTMDSRECQGAVSRKLNLKIVLPHWFDDCLKLGRRINETPYCLPDPEILNVQPGVKPRPSQTAFRGSVDPDPSGSAPRVAESRILTVFARRKVMLCADLGIGSRLKEILHTLIQGSSGQVVHAQRLADMYICKYREGNDYCAASQAAKEVGNLAWLYSLITTDKWTSPMSSLLHYPIAREGLPGLKGKLISLSNYSGDARVYLGNLISVSGASLTKTLKQENSHLLTAHNESEKCAAAREWGVHVVNHLWLEESYATWKVQSESVSQYTHFPPRTNLGDVVGQTKISRTALEQHFFGEDVEMEDAEDRPEPPTFNNAVNTSSTLNTPNHRPNSRQNLAQSVNGGTPSMAIRPGLGKENKTPSTGTRKSKEAASRRITSMTPDIMQFQKEMKRKGGVVYGGRRKSDQEETSFEKKRRREEEADDSETESEAKRQNTGVAPVSMYLMISGYEKWRGNPKVEATDKPLLRDMGIVITTEAKRATHLAAPTIVRTEKFVTAMAYAPMIISTDFIDTCLEMDRLVEPADFSLKDKVNEKKFHFVLAESLRLARKNKNLLLKDQTIFCTEQVPGGFDTFKHIIEANGGKCQSYTGRAGTTLPSNRGDDGEDGEVILISVKGQERVWRKFEKMAEDQGRKASVVATDWLLESALGQVMQATKKFRIG